VRAPSVAFFVMPEDGHVRRLLPLVRETAAQGAHAQVWTHARFRAEVLRAGAEFRDLLAGRALEDLGDESMPVPCRFVTFAGIHGDAVASEVARDRPSLVVYDSFAVVGRAVARRLDVPSAHACAGHAVDAERFRAALALDPRVRVSDRCLAAADRLRERFGLEDASPFAYVAPTSRLSNVYGEPPEWLDDRERARLEPVAFFGSVPGDAPAVRPQPEDRGRLRIYASLGTVVWRYYAAEARATLEAVAGAVAARGDAEATVALGGAPDAEALGAALAGPRVRVAAWADQGAALSEADLFVTHHGLNATHEAVWRGVPMLSLPFFWDQPALAARAQALGVAVRVGSGAPRAPVSPADVSRAIDSALARRTGTAERLSVARSWEERTIAGRPAVVDRMLRLASGTDR
jgi:MGT family glycosyltransferase